MNKLNQIKWPFLIGLSILALMAFIMLKISINFQLVFLLGTVLFFMGGLYSAKSEINMALLGIVINLPFAIAFWLIIYNQIPPLVGFPLFFYLATLLGVFVSKKKSNRTYALFTVFVLISVLISWKAIPIILSDQLTELKNDKVPAFTLVDLEGNEVTSEALEGKVLVLDFFGTWCAPCKLELKELLKIKQHFQASKDIVFYVINTGQGGDTIEKMKAFIEKNDYPFQFGFDANQHLVKKFKLNGLPYLFIFDKKGQLRLSHVGYNKGETQFAAEMIKTIESLRNEK